MVVLQIIFWICIGAILHTYFFYPFVFLKVFAAGKKQNQETYASKEELPEVTIIMAAFNEEKTVEEKIRSVFETDYPLNKIEFLVGSDNSSDRTNEILESLATEFSGLLPTLFKERQGKGNILTKLVKEAKGEIIIITDANVFLNRNTIFELVKHFKNNSIGLVDANFVNKRFNKDGISQQESTYISMEVVSKHNEGKIWGTMIGPFGGCFAMRKSLFPQIPKNMIAEDLFICMSILEKGYKAINELNAVVFEDVSNNIGIEFKRKVRIATGSFQNLSIFKKLLWPPFSGLGFSFLSHKVIRWFGPHLLILILVSNAILAIYNPFYLWLLFAEVAIYLIPLLDKVLKGVNFNFPPFRYITHLITMNIALFIGHIRFLKGVKSSTWKPTARD